MFFVSLRISFPLSLAIQFHAWLYVWLSVWLLVCFSISLQLTKLTDFDKDLTCPPPNENIKLFIKIINLNSNNDFIPDLLFERITPFCDNKFH